MSCRTKIFNRNLAEGDIPNALELADLHLGVDYLKEEDFMRAINSPTCFCRVISFNRQFTGFALCQIFGPDEIDGMLHIPDGPQKDRLLTKKKIGLLDAMTIREDSRHIGIGAELARFCYDEFVRRDVDEICALAWKHTDGAIPADSVLKKMGLSPSIEIPGYWNLKVDSPEGHNCPICGAPCKCSAVLYTATVR